MDGARSGGVELGGVTLNFGIKLTVSFRYHLVGTLPGIILPYDQVIGKLNFAN